jgi:hypothetical protein
MYVGELHGGSMALEATELDPHEPYNETRYPQTATGVWLLKSSVIRKNCLAQWGGQFNTSIGSLTCLDQRLYNVTTQKTQWWGSPNHTKPNPHPLSNFSHLQQAWNNVNTANIEWRAPSGPYWICGKTAYTVLPPNWSGSCVLGSVRPSFFLLPLAGGNS